MSFSPLIDRLIDAFRCLPGVGPKSAQRMAFHILEREQSGGQHLASALTEALAAVKHCKNCRNLTEFDQCQLCTDSRRDAQLICVVESPVDLVAIEQTGLFKGRYFVLMGHLSPIDGIGPSDIGIDLLINQVREQGVKELIMATNPTIEGETTAHFIAEQVRSLGVEVTRIAHGVPIGSELEYIDGGTLAHAFEGRRRLG